VKGRAQAIGKIRASRWHWLLAVAWTLIAAGALIWNLSEHEKHAVSEIKSQARTLFNQDLIYRRWNAGHGGVYVPVTKQTPPNPYLAHIPERDIATPSGKKLTLMNPAYMTRQVHELMQQEKDGVRGHITSLKPIRPENAADPWETAALRRFEKGASEYSSLERMPDGKEYLRFMRPMRVEKACLKCHAAQGYKIGDIRGGISVSIPVSGEMVATREEAQSLYVGHGILWFLGLGAILLVASKQASAEEALIRSESRTRLLLDSTAEAIYGIDLDGNCTFANPACLKLLGYDDMNEVVGRNTHKLFYHTRPDGTAFPAEECSIFGVVSKGEGIHMDGEVMWRKDGSSFPVEYWSHPVREENRVSGAVVTFMDISERKSSQEALGKRLNELERFQQATIEREFRIKELRDELARLKGASGGDREGKHEAD